MERGINFKSGELTLEGVLHLPADVRGRVPAIVVCHPHPLYGGSMHNVIIEKLCRKLEESGLVALRFNFRGVGFSEGSYNEGSGEVLDAKAAIDFLETIDFPVLNAFGVAGYSFGAYIAARVAEDPRVKAMALISPPLALYNFDFLKRLHKPKLIIWGDQDEFVGITAEEMAHIVAGPKRLVLVGGADHFWYGYEDEICTIVTAFFEDVFGTIS